jgi:hypothetical protein
MILFWFKVHSLFWNRSKWILAFHANATDWQFGIAEGITHVS